MAKYRDAHAGLITFEEARTAVTTELAPTWNFGTLYVAPWGFESDLFFHVIVGPYEGMVLGHPAFADREGLSTIVDKVGARVIRVNTQANLLKLASMTPVNDRVPVKV